MMIKKTMKLPQIGGALGTVYLLFAQVHFDLKVYFYCIDDSPPYGGGSQATSGLISGVCSQQGKRPYQEDEYAVSGSIDCSSFLLLLKLNLCCF